MPKDLDQSDVIRDAEEMREAYILAQSEGTDPVDIITVATMVCDAYFSGNAAEFLISNFCRDLIQFSQSNPDGVHDKIANALHAQF